MSIFQTSSSTGLTRVGKNVFEEERQYLKPLPARRLADYAEIRGVLVGKGSTITVRKKVYSVHSRLCNEHVTVRLYAEYLEVLFGSTVVEKLPRLRGADKHPYQLPAYYRLVSKKTGSFCQLPLPLGTFPHVSFSYSYDLLREQNPLHACR